MTKYLYSQLCTETLYKGYTYLFLQPVRDQGQQQSLLRVSDVLCGCGQAQDCE